MDLDWSVSSSSEEEDEAGSRPPAKAPLTAADLERIAKEREERRRVHFRSARQRAKENKRARGVRRDFTWKNEALEDIKFYKPAVVIDLSFCELLRDKEVVSVANQVQHCYGLNRKAAHVRPLELHMVGTELPAIARVFERHEGFKFWKVFRHPSGNVRELFPADRIVYLSPESSNVLEELDEDAVYVIGGISDNQNELKGTTLLHAAEAGLAHARLPLQEHCPELTTRGTVLNINHCYEILLLRAQGVPWAEAIDRAVPTRQSFRAKSE